MKRIPSHRFFPSALLALVLFWAAPAGAEVLTIFEGTQYPLYVHVLRGEEPGPTVMVQGGIQGDEITGFITAQLLTRSTVRSGTLIVIPRANVPSINLRQRLVNVDLNRRFDQDYNQFYEDHLARAIRFFLTKSDAFIHLHEGSGFYSPTYVDKMRNPHRYGQSVIIDTPVYKDRIHLASYVERVLARLNKTIEREDYHFQIFSTDTFDTTTVYSEQRKSLTFFALSQLTIPALAIEVSKAIHDIDWKVRHQLRAATMFLEEFGVRIEPPDHTAENIRLYPPETPMLELGGQEIRPGETTALSLPACMPLHLRAGRGVADVMAPAAAVFASDRPDTNLLEAPRLPLSDFSTLQVRADGKAMAEIRVRWTGDWPRLQGGDTPWMVCWLNGRLHVVPEGHVLDAVNGDQLILEGVYGKSGEILNLKGFVSNYKNNDGQDAGREIILDPDMFITRYLDRGDAPDEWICRVVRETPGEKSSSFGIRIRPRTVQAVKLTNGLGGTMTMPWSQGERFRLPAGRYTLSDIWSNGPRRKLVALVNDMPLPWDGSFTLEQGSSVLLSFRHATTFKPMGQMELAEGPETPQATTLDKFAASAY